jgi:hypothetical protein
MPQVPLCSHDQVQLSIHGAHGSQHFKVQQECAQQTYMPLAYSLTMVEREYQTGKKISRYIKSLTSQGDEHSLQSLPL